MKKDAPFEPSCITDLREPEPSRARGADQESRVRRAVLAELMAGTDTDEAEIPL